MFLLTRLFNKMIREGELTIVDHRGTVHRFGAPSATIRPVTFRLTDARTARAIALGPAIGAGEGYMDGRLIMEDGDIKDLVHLVTHNVRWDRDNPIRLGLWRQAAIAAKLDQINFSRRSKRNVAHHYDLSDRLYDLFLDADRQYSCAYYDHDDDSLETAQAHKKAHIAAKLDLKPGQRVLDIGCGWGGMALYLHRVAGVDVTGVTLSEEQLKVARRRAAEAGVSDHVRFELIDYRALTGQFDRIVSVGMFEHVGLPHYRQFFDKVHSLLTPDGVALIHTIARADGPGATDPWTAKYIFPGGYAPALSQITPAVERAWLWITDIEVLRLHYALTLEEWYRRAVAAEDKIVALYDARFFRMWQFYLAAAIAAFRNDGHMNVQVQLTRKRDVLPITRDYMAAAEMRYRAIDEQLERKTA
ncbi:MULTISPECIES: SAM-dependent methyltransferase [Sphingosinicellaceae]|uniref:SAM-dependent methyltransferase n=1 Tax=Sphingosinicellaceae TaxID=2820280 RepID=UPI001C1E584B|nr:MULTISPECIES: cyclopropane-fatty-acyl-phospholipid synthase family protein [Polymorphobacter]QYE35357.1 cyclopropane-fatty-acyl-phospholipid synthase family protein [Polymorphobacter sp. PAMC 29334]UAJ11337.1 cyclopropane-fatty-acyl-phospholipid synthase family protein [Polymorphobacter megasporae]